MIHEGALPIGQQIALDFIVPPIVTGIWWLLSNGWSAILGTTNSQAVKSWRRPAILIVLIVCYVVAFGVTAYGYFS